MEDCAQVYLSLLEAHPPARLLDLACGCGAATTAMALRGFEVTGIDCTPASIEIARRMSKLKGATVRWICQDMRSIEDHQAFDYVCLRDVIFGIFPTAEEDVDLLGRMSRALKPGGRCLLEVYNREFAIQNGVENSLHYDPASDRFVPPIPIPGGLSGIRLYSPDQWTQMLASHGLRIVKTAGWSWPNDPPAPPFRADYIVAEIGRRA